MSLPWNEDGVGAGFIRCQRGFTLVEILVATAVGLVVVAGIFAFNRFQLRSLQGQAHQLDIQGTTRGLTLLLEQEVRNAGTNPRAVATFSAIAHRSDAGEIHLQSDYNGDGRVDDDGEDVRYVLDVENQRILRFDDGDSEVLIDRIVLNGARFRYFNGAGVELTPGDQGLTSAQRNAVRKVRLELAMEQQNLGLANFARMSTDIDLRNRFFVNNITPLDTVSTLTPTRTRSAATPTPTNTSGSGAVTPGNATSTPGAPPTPTVCTLLRRNERCTDHSQCCTGYCRPQNNKCS